MSCYAMSQGREVFALPGRIDSSGSVGSNALIKQGAKLVTCCDDILEELNLAAVDKVDKKEKSISPARQEIEYAKEEGILYECIGPHPVAIDDLVEKTSLPISQVLGLVLKLQFKKLIRELPGKQFMRNYN